MDVEVNRTDLHRVRVHEQAPVPLAPGEARLRVLRFGLSSNNVTYAVFGDALRYWSFFPPADGGTEWGRVPVWGFGEVVETRSPDVAVGERLYGYYPMSSELVIVAGRDDEHAVHDVAPHRASMAAAYSRYVRCATDPLHRADREDQQMLLHPLFVTAFLLDDALADEGTADAAQIVVSSASSKTASALAHLAGRRGARVVGLTSAANVDFVEGLGAYGEVLAYDDTAALSVVPSVYVDVAGDRDVLVAVHERLAGALERSLTVGGTHWDHRPAQPDAAVPPPAPEFFFAPSRLSQRARDWGPEGLDERIARAWAEYVAWTDGWLEVRSRRGADAVAETFLELLSGRVDPRVGFACTLTEEEHRP